MLDEVEDEVEVEKKPLCVIKILSPFQSLQELLDKAKIYFEQGILSYWLVWQSFETSMSIAKASSITKLTNEQSFCRIPYWVLK